MDIGWIITLVIVGIFVGYAIVIFVLPRLFIPFMGFRKEKIPRKLPRRIQRRIHLLRKRSKNKQDYLKKTYNYLTRRYHGKRNTVLKRPGLWWEKNLQTIWSRKGFLPCHTFTHMMRIFLVKSRMFKEKDVRVNHTFYWFNIHQYLEVRVKKKWHKVDAWAKGIGIKFGDYGRLFK